MLVSSADFFRVQPQAQTHYGCAGNGKQFERQFSPLCDRMIHRGDEYVEQLALVGTGRAVPRLLYVASRHCAHCSLAFFPKIGLKETADQA